MNPAAIQELKKAIFSVLIGVAVTLITQLAGVIVEWLQTLTPEAIGSAVAVYRFYRPHA